jgi:type IV fimbrial biogenesis protein FimT
MTRAAPRTAARHGCASGTSIVELIAVIAVLGILLAAAVPSLYGFMLAHRVSDGASSFVRSLMLARSEALKRNRPVRMCATSNGSSCDTTVSWESGWIVYVDANANATFDAGDEAVRVFPSLVSSLTLRGSTGLGQSIGFDTAGRPTATGWFALCNGSLLSGSRAIFVNGVGRIRLAQDQDGDGVPESPTGADITTCSP